MRAGQSQANNLQNQAGSTAAGYGTSAEGISSTLTPFLTRELNNPGGISQQDQTAMLSAGVGGSGGAASGIESRLNQRASASGNESGFGAAADDTARQAEKAAAQQGSSVANENTRTKLEQQQQGASGLRGLYGADVNAQLGSLGIQNNAINTEINAGKSGWFQNMNQLIQTLKGGGGPPQAADTDGGGGMGDSGMGDPSMAGFDDDALDAIQIGG